MRDKGGFPVHKMLRGELRERLWVAMVIAGCALFTHTRLFSTLACVFPPYAAYVTPQCSAGAFLLLLLLLNSFSFLIITGQPQEMSRIVVKLY